MTSVADPTSFTIIPYPIEEGRGISVLENPKALQLSENLDSARDRMVLQRDADKSFGRDVVQFDSIKPNPVTLTPQEKTIAVRNKYNQLFKDDIFGKVSDFEKQVIKNDFEQEFMNGKGYWEALLHLFVSEGMKPKYGFGGRAGTFQVEFTGTNEFKRIESLLRRHYQNSLELVTKNDRRPFNQALELIVNDIPNFWLNKAQMEGRSVEKYEDLRGGSKKRTTRKYKNRKLTYRRNKKNRTTKNKRRYSRRK
jgi:hypothetical protein